VARIAALADGGQTASRVEGSSLMIRQLAGKRADRRSGLVGSGATDMGGYRATRGAGRGMVKACLLRSMMRRWNRPRTRGLHGLANGAVQRWFWRFSS